MTDPASLAPCGRLAGPPDDDGWVRRTVADRARVDELVALYRGYGFETRIVALDADRFGESCRACVVAAGACVALFTRPVAPDAGRSPAPGAR